MKIQIFTSYFYQVRNMLPYMIPMSTALSDPKWYRGIHKDKNGVYNGLRAPVFAPGSKCKNLCHGPRNCVHLYVPTECPFLSAYREQLFELDYNNIIFRIERLSYYIKSLEKFKEDPIAVLLVHEAPNNPCSERRIIQEWFKINGNPITEWEK